MAGENKQKSGFVPSVTVVICTHERPLLLERCLQNLEQIDYPDYSVLVVDSAPQSSATRLLASRYRLKYEVSPLKGLSRARNVGARATQTDVIAYLDDDMVAHSGWLRTLIEEFSDKNVAAVTGPTLDFEFVDSIRSGLHSQVNWAPCGLRRFHIDCSAHQWFERANFGGIGDGNFALRRNAFDQIRGFDERLGLGSAIDRNEEHYAFFRLVDFGFKIVYAPKAIVFHPKSSELCEARRKQLTELVAYAAFLAFNHPSKSLRVFRFLIEGVFGARRWWRTPSERSLASLPYQDKLFGGLSGLSAFLKSVR